MKQQKQRTSFEQAALDLIAKAQETGVSQKKIDILQEALRVERGLKCRDDADRVFASHQYRSCRFGQLSLVTDNPVVWPLLKSLSHRARSVLLLIMVIAKTEYIAISKAQLEKIAGYAEKSRHIDAIITELVESTALEIVARHTNRTPTVYRISSALYRVGKRRGVKEDDVARYFKDEMPDFDKTAEWFQIVLRREDSKDYRTTGTGWYSGTTDVTINRDGVPTKVKASILQYYDPDSDTDTKKEPSPKHPAHRNSPQSTKENYIMENVGESTASGIPGQMTLADYGIPLEG